jgi:hypothetical protein
LLCFAHQCGAGIPICRCSGITKKDNVVKINEVRSYFKALELANNTCVSATNLHKHIPRIRVLIAFAVSFFFKV